MALTLLLTLTCIAGVFLMLFAEVAFIQDKRYLGTAPKDVREKVQVHEERFPGMHILGYVLGVVAIAMIAGSVVIAVWDGNEKEYGFLQFFIRFMIMLEGYKIWDMLFLDNYLLTKSRFFKHYYPEIEECESLKESGSTLYNFKEQVLKLLVIFPVISLAIAALCVVIGNWI